VQRSSNHRDPLPHVEAASWRPAGGRDTGPLAAPAGVPTTADADIRKSSLVLGRAPAPAGTPAGIVDKLNATSQRNPESKEAQAGLARLGAEAKIGAPRICAFIAPRPAWAAIANETSIKVD